MVKCPNCGEENRDGLKVCLYCGAEIPENQDPDEWGGGVPTKESNLLRNIIIGLVAIIIICGLVLNVAPLFTDNVPSNSIQLDEDSQNLLDDGSSSSEDDSSTASDSENSWFSSSKKVDFDNLFTMEVDENESFRDYNYEDYNSSRSWVNQGYNDVGVDSSVGIGVYYWKNANMMNLANAIVDSSSQMYQPHIDGDLVILQFDTASEENPSYYDYFVFTSSEDNVVGLMGANEEKLVQYANTVKFN